MSILILLTYPLLSHFFVLLGQPQWVVIYLLVIVGLFFIKAFVSRNLILAFLMAFLLIVGAGLIIQEKSTVIIYLPPIMINLGLLLIFWRSLQRDQVPLITRYAQLIDGNLNEEMNRYTKRVTVSWTILFIVMLIESIGLAIFASDEVWSLFTNFINYGVIFLMFITEYLYRNAAFPDLPKRGFFQFLRQIMQIRPSQLKV